MISLLVYFQVDLQAQARAHRIGQKRDVLVLRFETVHTNPLLTYGLALMSLLLIAHMLHDTQIFL